MKEPQEYARTSKDRTKWTVCDPMSLVAAARDGLSEIPEHQRQNLSGPLEEVISRFEHQSRIALGPALATAAGEFSES